MDQVFLSKHEKHMILSKRFEKNSHRRISVINKMSPVTNLSNLLSVFCVSFFNVLCQCEYS